MNRLSGPTIALGSILATLLVAELALRSFASVPDPYERRKHPLATNAHVRSQFPPNLQLKTEAEDGLPGVHGENRFSTNNMGFRGDGLLIPKPAAEYRIFIVGGSTTESFYLDDEDALSAVLQRELQASSSRELTIKVYGAGKSGDNSDDHISMLTHRIVHLEPDLIVVFSGINDLSAAIRGYDYLHYEQSRPLQFSTGLLLRLMATEFQFGRRFYYLLKRIAPPTEQELLADIRLKSNYRGKVEARRKAPIAGHEPRTDLRSYEDNLLTIVGVAKAHKITLVLMTQQTTWNSTVDPSVDQWQWFHPGDSAYRADLMDRAIEFLNNVMRDVARDHNVPLYDLAAQMPKTLQFFYDDVHFNITGARAAGIGLAHVIVENLANR